ncbi:MAG: aminomethyltransferase family protein [Candidatus Polarisedimenticolia bacterium]
MNGTDPRAQHHAARTAVAIADRSTFGRLRATGAKRLDLLHRLITQDVRSLSPGQGARAAVLTDKGRLMDLLMLYVREDHVVIVTSPGQSPTIQQHIESLRFRDDVRLEDVTQATAMFDLIGPRAPALLAPNLEALPRHHSVAVQVAGHEVLAARTMGLHELGLRLLVPSDGAGAVRSALLEQGAVPIGEEALEVLRIERGQPRFGREITLEHNPLEARLDDAISWTKGCYIGQEVVARLDSRNKVSRLLSGLRLAADAPVPSHGDRVDAPDRPGVEAGLITSAARSWEPRETIALAYLRQDATAPGTRVVVTIEGKQHEAVVSDLPFAR